VATYYTDERTLKIAGDEETFAIIPGFKGAMLRGNTDVQVQAGSTMPRSKAAMQAAMQDTLNQVLQYGVQVDQRALRKFFQAYGVGGLELLTSEIDLDARQVAREHQRLQAGQPFSTNEWDNDEFHVQEHNDFRKKGLFERLAPQLQQFLAQHVAEHQQKIQLAQQQQFKQQVAEQQAMMAAQPQPPTQGGAPSGP
jgi:hypothetical protein